MRKYLLWVVVLVISISMVAAFTLSGCKEEAAPVEEEAEEEAVEEEVEEEEVVEEEVEAKEPVNIIIYLEVMGEPFEHLFERFTEDTGYPIELEAIQSTDILQVVSSRFITKEVPDIQIYQGTPMQYSALNPADNLLDLTDWTAENIAGTVLDQSFIDSQALYGKTYGVPITGITVRGAFYNKNVLEASGAELPTSWDNFIDEVAPKIKDAGYTPIYSMGQDMWGSGIEADSYIADQFATTDIQDRLNNNEATIIETDFLDAFRMQQRILELGYYNDDLLVGTYDGAVEALSNDEAFMTFLSIVCCTRFEEDVMENLGGLCLSKEGNRTYYAPPNYAYIPKYAKNMDGAMAFIEWFTQPENLNEFYRELKMLSPYKGITDVELYPVAEDFKKYFEAEAGYASTLLVSPGYTFDQSAKIFAGTTTPEAACEEMWNNFVENAKAAGLEAFQ